MDLLGIERDTLRERAPNNIGSRDGTLVEIYGDARGFGSGTHRGRSHSDGEQPEVTSMVESRSDHDNADSSSGRAETYSIDVELGSDARARSSFYRDGMGNFMRSVSSMGQSVTQVDLPVRRQARDAGEGGRG